MHNEYNITSDWVNLIQSISDELIIEMTSRGLFNRLLNAEINIMIKSIDDELIILIMDDEEVKITKLIEKATCSCDKVIKCKHIVGALLYLRNQTSLEENEVTALNFSVSKQQLIKEFNTFQANIKQNIFEALVYVDKFEFIETRNIIVKDYNDISVIYYNSEFSNSLCSCKKNKCIHSFINKYAYAVHKNIIHLSDLQKPKINQSELKQLIQLKKKILDLVSNGITQTSNSEVYELELIVQNQLTSKVLKTQLEHVITMIYHHLDNINFYPLYVLAEQAANLVILIDILVENRNQDISSIIKLDETENYKKAEIKEISLIYLGYYYQNNLDDYQIIKLYLHPNNKRFYHSVVEEVSYYELSNNNFRHLNTLLLHNITMYRTTIKNQEIEYKKTQSFIDNHEIETSHYSTDINNSRKIAASIGDLFSFDSSMYFYLDNITITNVSFFRASLKLLITLTDHEKKTLVIEHPWRQEYSSQYNKIEKKPEIIFSLTSLVIKYVVSEHKFIFLFGYNKDKQIIHIEVNSYE